ncbi:MAG: zinc metalloprotease HtpX [Candidatus Nanoarchaeia archaeon]
MKNQIKTIILLVILSAIFLGIGSIWGRTGLLIAFILALIMNISSYWFSDKLILKMYKAQPSKNKELNTLVKELAKKANLPEPAVYIIPTQHMNAFATGRNKKHAAVACTQGMLNQLNKNELKGVLAHELSHIKNHDTLIQVIVATIASAIMYIALIARWAAIFGDDDSSFIQLLVLGIITPITASLIQLSISRSREYLADKNAASLLGDGKPLADALTKLKHNKPVKGNQATSSLFIVNPFTKKGLLNLLSTHPDIDDRIKKLKAYPKH